MNRELNSIHALHILKSNAWGGLELYSLDIIQKFNETGITSTLLCLKNSRVEIEAKSRNIPIVYSSSCIRSEKFTHIHVHQRKDLPLVRIFLIGLTKPLFYSLYMSAPPKKDLYHQWVYGRINALASSSLWVNDEVKKNFPIAHKNIHLIRYGRNQPLSLPSQSEIDDLKEQLHSSAGKIILGSMCRLDEGKGVLELVLGLQKLPDEILNKVELWVIGDRTLKKTLLDGTPIFEEQSQSVYEKILAIAEDPRLKNSLKMIPFQKNINLYLKAMDAFVIGSYEETYSLAVIDAMILGLPILGTKSGGTVEQIGSNQERGYFFLPRNPDSTSEAFSTAILNLSELKSKGLSAKKWSAEQHSWDHCLKQWSELYKFEVSNR